MKKFKWSLALILGVLLTAGRSMAFGDFEGQVDMKMTHKGSDKVTDMKYLVKGSKLRMQVESAESKYKVATIMDMKKHQLITVMDDKKMYMVTDIHPEKFAGPKKDHHFSIKKTGNSETILGHDCQEWDYSSDDSSGKIWFTKGLGNWWGNSMAAQSDKLPSDQKAMVKTMLSEKLFPMKYQFNDKSGTATGTMEVTNIEKKSLSSDLFEPPAGYKKVSVPSFGGDGSGKKPSKEDILKMMQQFKH
jgi:hypothetical protein